MPISILDPTVIGAFAALGGVVPKSTVRKFIAAGAHNKTDLPVMLSVHLVPKDALPNVDNRIIYRPVAPAVTDTCPELIGRGLSTDGALWVDSVGLVFGYTALDTIIG